MRTVFITISLLFLFACGSDEIPMQNVSIPVKRLEGELFNKKSAAEISTFLKEERSFSNLFLDAAEYPDDSILAKRIYDLIQNPSIDTLYDESVATFQDLTPIVSPIETAVGKLKSIYPETKTPRFITAVTGLYRDLYYSDSLIIVGLDFFVGQEATFKPVDIPFFMLYRYDQLHLPAIIIKAMSGSQVTNGKSSTLLSEMIDFGKTYYLASRLAPSIADSVLLGYTAEDMIVIRENEPIIWANFIENEVLYETSHIVKRKFLGERPNVYEISQKCPGRIGAWVGWNIVEQYMKNNSSVTIQQLLEDSDNEKIFKLSGYKPQSR